jgi:hypothetical protein
MDRDQTILEAARAIRPYLARLEVPDAARTDAMLAAALAEDADHVLVVLRAHDATWQWFLDFAKTGLPPDVAILRERAYDPMPGHGDPVSAPRFECPRKDYVWYRRAVGQEPPLCPTHLVPLEWG